MVIQPIERLERRYLEWLRVTILPDNRSLSVLIAQTVERSGKVLALPQVVCCPRETISKVVVLGSGGIESKWGVWCWGVESVVLCVVLLVGESTG